MYVVIFISTGDTSRNFVNENNEKTIEHESGSGEVGDTSGDPFGDGESLVIVDEKKAMIDEDGEEKEVDFNTSRKVVNSSESIYGIFQEGLLKKNRIRGRPIE